MKFIIFLGDGMADYAIPELGGKTPLMAARKPAMDSIAREGRTGLFRTIGPGMLTGSAIANLSVLGYDSVSLFQGTEGRGILEAASLGVELSDSALALRINLICVENNRIRSHSAGHIGNQEAHQLIHDLAEHFKDWNLKLYPGLSYRHVLVVPEGEFRLDCYPPHDHVGVLLEELKIKPQTTEGKHTADLLNNLVTESRQFLDNHPINQKRRTAGEQPANSLWPWAPGKKPHMETIEQRFGVRGAAITAVDLIKGLAIYAGMMPIPVPGATGLYDTNYEGKADAALQALDHCDFVYIHVEAPDEAGHERNLELKIRTIEDLDQRLIQRVIDGLARKKMEATLAVLPDHATPIAYGNHTREPVPVAILTPGIPPDSVNCYDEESVKTGSLGMLEKDEFIRTFFGSR